MGLFKKKKRIKRAEAARPAQDKRMGLYIHIPFCVRKCGYCDFYSVTDLTKAARYVDALIAQMKAYSLSTSGYLVDSIYIGGGTPSALPKKLIKKMFEGIHQNFRVTSGAEITVEVNPGAALKPVLRAYKKQGVNRFSVGLQSAHNDELVTLTRIHTANDFTATIEILKKLKIDNISADLMYGIPGQTLPSLLSSIDFVVKFGLSHISLYGLKIEEGTPFENRQFTGLPTEELEREMYFEGIDRLSAAGFEQYEISNFAKPGFRCAHNLKYWNCEEYLGLGPGAASYLGGRRFRFIRNIDDYMDILLGGEKKEILAEVTDSPRSENAGEYVMLRLRLNEGIDIKKYNSIYRPDFMSLFGDKLGKYVGSGHMTADGERVALTREGFLISNYILADLLSLGT